MELSYSGSGNVHYQEKEYRCDLYLNENEGGILLRIYVDKAMASFVELPFEIDYLPGTLDNGFNFTAFGCYRTNMESRISEGQSVFTFQAHSMLKGVGASNHEGTKLYKVQYGLEGVLEWGSFSGYRISENFELGTGDHVEIVIYENDQITIKYTVSASMLPVVQQELLNDSITLSQQGVIEIESKTPETITFFEAYYRIILQLIEISMLRIVKLRKVTGWSHSVCYEIKDRHIERPVPIISDELFGEGKETPKQISSWKWLTLPELLANNSFGLYFEKYKKLEPIVELYMEAYSSNGISSKRLFLNLVQGLETYHSRFITNDLKTFKRRIRDVILKTRAEQFIKADTSFLMAKSHRFITLESRLADLLLANFEIWFDTGDIQRYDFPEVISNTRNYLIHYDERIKQSRRILTDEEVDVYNKTLLFMLEYYLLRELGFSNIDDIREKLNHRWGNISTTLSIIKASKEKSLPIQDNNK